VAIYLLRIGCSALVFLLLCDGLVSLLGCCLLLLVSRLLEELAEREIVKAPVPHEQLGVVAEGALAGMDAQVAHDGTALDLVPLGQVGVAGLGRVLDLLATLAISDASGPVGQLVLVDALTVAVQVDPALEAAVLGPANLVDVPGKVGFDSLVAGLADAWQRLSHLFKTIVMIDRA